MHRPATVDDPELLNGVMDVLETLAREWPVIFPIHPRTRARIAQKHTRAADTKRVHIIDPVGYLEFLGLEKNARLVITDSGGVQEETTYLRVPCLTVRDNTERPVTITTGSNTLVGRDPRRLLVAARQQLASPTVSGAIPELWDGHAAKRIADVLQGILGPVPAKAPLHRVS